MKQTVNVNIASQAFTLDEDAYRVLQNYLDDIRRRLPEGDGETIGDIESHIAGILRESTPSPMLVVTIDTVRATIARVGSPADFGECCRGGQAQGATCEQNRGDTCGQSQDATCGQATEPMQPRQLCRSRSNRSIAGVCGGLARHFNIDPTLLRLAMLLLIVFGGISIWVYVILWIVIPEEPAREFELNNKKQ